MGEFRMAAYSDLFLETPRLRLRPYRSSDADDVFALFSDRAVMRYWSSAPWTEHQQALDFLARDAASLAEGSSARLGIERKADGALIGNCTLFSFDAQCRRAETGYVLSPAAWGHGYAHEGVTALLDWGFEALDLNRVEADIDPRNTPSSRALERLGFVREGHLRQRWIVNGEVTDSFIYGLLRSEWKARR
jgi:ribosomal-protein-alanine N-acetyltransferase